MILFLLKYYYYYYYICAICMFVFALVWWFAFAPATKGIKILFMYTFCVIP